MQSETVTAAPTKDRDAYSGAVYNTDLKEDTIWVQSVQLFDG